LIILTKKAAVLGDINIDIITPPFKLPEDESSCVLDEFTLSLGGNAINVAATLASLGADHEFFGAMGDDAISQWIISKCKMLKINSNLKILTGHSAGITFAMTYFEGRRQFVATLGTNQLLKLDHIDTETLLKSDHLHRSGFWYTPQLKGEPTILLMKKMISNGKQTSLDVGWDPAGFNDQNRELLYKTLEYCEFFFANEKELKAITKKTDLDDAVKILLNISKTIDDPKIIIHQGNEGSTIVTKKDKIKIPTKDVPQNNPTGTGDIYNAGFIYGLLNNWNLEKCGIYADKVACVHLKDKSKIYPSKSDLE